MEKLDLKNISKNSSNNKVANQNSKHLDGNSVLDFKDSNRAVIYNQYPDPNINNKSFISIGSLVIIDANLSTPLDSIYDKDTVGLNYNI